MVFKNTFCVCGGVGASKSARHGCECTLCNDTDHHHRGPTNHTAHHRGTHSTHGHSRTPHRRGKGWPASCTWNTSCTEPSALAVQNHVIRVLLLLLPTVAALAAVAAGERATEVAAADVAAAKVLAEQEQEEHWVRSVLNFWCINSASLKPAPTR